MYCNYCYCCDQDTLLCLLSKSLLLQLASMKWWQTNLIACKWVPEPSEFLTNYLWRKMGRKLGYPEIALRPWYIFLYYRKGREKGWVEESWTVCSLRNIRKADGNSSSQWHSSELSHILYKWLDQYSCYTHWLVATCAKNDFGSKVLVDSEHSIWDIGQYFLVRELRGTFSRLSHQLRVLWF